MEPYRLIYVTIDDPAAAQALAERLIEQRLAACVHLLPAGQSIYWWEGAVQRRAEQVLLAKTSAAMAEPAIAAIARWHGDDCPCVLSLPIAEGYAPFLDWIRSQTAEA